MEPDHPLGKRTIQPMRPIKRACAICHSRKVKCDGALNGFPCTNCKASDMECYIAARRKRRRLSRRILGQQEDVAPPREVSPLHAETRHTARALELSAETMDVGTAAEQLTQLAHGRRDYDGEREVAKKHLVDFLSQDLQENPIKARLVYVGNELSNINHLTRQRAANHRVFHYPCSSSSVSRVPHGPRSVATPTPTLIPQDAFVKAPQHILDVLVNAYFDQIHPGFPIIDKERFLSQYHGKGPSQPSLLLLQSICLVGAHVSDEFNYDHTQNLKMTLFRRAKALFDGRYEEDRMEMVQAALLLTWFSDGGDDICANAWWWIGTAARTAVALGMHRDISPSKMPEADKRTWKMIWWAVVQFDCIVSLNCGRPQSINLDDSDTEPLCLQTFADGTDSTAANFAIYHGKLCVILSDLVRSYFSVRARKSGIRQSTYLHAVDAAMVEWLSSLPADLHEQRAFGSNESSFWPLLLHLTYNTALIQFYRPHADAILDADALATKEIGAGAASTIIRIVDHLNRHSLLQRCPFWVPSSLFTAMLQIQAQTKSNNPILALKAKETHECGLKLLQTLSQHWPFASSVWALFRFGLTKADSRKDTGPHSQPAQDLAGHERGLSVAPPADSVGSSYAQTTADIFPIENSIHDSQETDWMQMICDNEVNSSYIQTERNRWQDSVDEWRSLYWSDTLTEIRMQEHVGDVQFNWPT